MKHIERMLVVVWAMCFALFQLSGCPGDWFSIRIDRFAGDEFEEFLIQAAENIYPSLDRNLEISSFSQLPEPPESRWWGGEFDGVLVPYAITSNAIEYYRQLVLAWREGSDPTGGPFRWRGASLRYTARVQTETDFRIQDHVHEKVFIVWMNLEWSATCGFVCGHGWSKERVVVMSPDGEAVLVLGDGAFLTRFYIS